MTTKIDKKYLTAQLQSLEELLKTLSSQDVLTRMGLEAKKSEIVSELQRVADLPDNTVQVALYFGGEPVIGSTGIQAEFASSALSTFQDMITKVWSKASTGTLSEMGPIRDKDGAALHITSLVHGSFGFLLEEIDQRGQPLFESSLKKAAEQVVEYLAGFADPDENRFTKVLESIHPRVFTSLKSFYGTMFREHATFRMVEGEIDQSFDQGAVERAWHRADESNVDEEEKHFTGKLLGVIPIKRRFEFEPDGSTKIIEGKVGDEFSQNYLERMTSEQFAGKRWNAFFKYRVIEKPGRMFPIEQYTLLKLDLIEKPQQ